MATEQQILSIYSILGDVYGQSPWSLDQIKADVVKPESDYFFAYDQEKIVGFLACQLLAGEIEITNIAVKRSHLGQGFADYLMRQLTFVDQPIFLEVRASNTPAQALYAKHNFRVVGERRDYYRHPIENAVIMMRD